MNCGVHHSYAFAPLSATETGTHTLRTTFLLPRYLLIPTKVCGVESLFWSQRECAHVQFTAGTTVSKPTFFPTKTGRPESPPHRRPPLIPPSSLSSGTNTTVLTTPWFWWHNLFSPLSLPAFLNARPTTNLSCLPPLLPLLQPSPL